MKGGEEMELKEFPAEELEAPVEELQEVPGNLIAFEKAFPLSAPEITELVKQATVGDKNAFSALFMNSYRYVYGILRRHLSNEEDIRDTLQEVYIRVYTNISQLKDPKAFPAWLTRVTLNCARDSFARTRRSLRIQDELLQHTDPEDFLQEDTAESDLAMDVTDILKQLPEDQASLLVMLYYDGMTVAEIARMLKKPATTIYSQVNRAKKQLKVLLKHRGIDKPFYGGSFVAMITTALRNAIGTEILSATVAEEILQNVYEQSEKKKAGAVLTKISKQQRTASVLRIASLIVALSVVTSGGTVLLIRSQNPGDTAQDAVTSDSSAIQSEGVSSVPSSPENGTVSSAASSAVQSEDSFLPDYSPGKANTVGNSPNNLGLAYGGIAQQDGWLYFTTGMNCTFLYKMRTDGSERQLVTDEIGSHAGLNVVGDWIYYGRSAGIWKIRTDGSQKTLLDPIGPQTLSIIGNTGYFSMENNGTSICQIDLETGLISTVQGKTTSSYFAIYQEKLYYSNDGLWEMDLSTGTNRKLSSISAERLQFAGDILFFSSSANAGGKVYWLYLSESEPTTRSIFSADTFSYSPANGGCLVYRVDTSNHEQIYQSSSYHTYYLSTHETVDWTAVDSDTYLENFYSVDDTYFYAYHNHALYRFRVDGSTMEKVG